MMVGSSSTSVRVSPFSAGTKLKKKGDDGWDSWDEAISNAEEKKHSLKDLIKRRLRPRPTPRPEAPSGGGTLERDRKPVQSENDQPTTYPEILQNKLEVVLLQTLS